ncbi:unnamed protein product [Ectocarpus sp. 8 AP-2014]
MPPGRHGDGLGDAAGGAASGVVDVSRLQHFDDAFLNKNRPPHPPQRREARAAAAAAVAAVHSGDNNSFGRQQQHEPLSKNALQGWLQGNVCLSVYCRTKSWLLFTQTMQISTCHDAMRSMVRSAVVPVLRKVPKLRNVQQFSRLSIGSVVYPPRNQNADKEKTQTRNSEQAHHAGFHRTKLAHHQPRSTVRYSASRMEGVRLHPAKGVRHLELASLRRDDSGELLHIYSGRWACLTTWLPSDENPNGSRGGGGGMKLNSLAPYIHASIRLYTPLYASIRRRFFTKKKWVEMKPRTSTRLLSLPELTITRPASNKSHSKTR